MATQAFSSADIRWDLGDLFASVDDPKIESSLRDALARAQAFVLKYRNTINVAGGPAPAHLLAAIQESEALQQDLKRLTTFADLLYAADTSHPGHRNLREKVELSATEISNHILFFELEWMQLTDEDADHLSVLPSLAGYRHYLQRVRTYRPHRLSEP